MKRWILAVACGIAALGLLLYPLIGELVSEKYHSDVEITYTAAIATTDDVELDKVSGRIVGEVKHINRICYDITSKPWCWRRCRWRRG